MLVLRKYSLVLLSRVTAIEDNEKKRLENTNQEDKTYEAVLIFF